MYFTRSDLSCIIYFFWNKKIFVEYFTYEPRTGPGILFCSKIEQNKMNPKASFFNKISINSIFKLQKCIISVTMTLFSGL